VINDELRSGEFRYIFHIVKAGETLYGISRIYDLKVDQLKEANPGWEQGLKPGQYLKVPMKERVEVAIVEPLKPVEEKPQEEKKYLEHTVKQKETLYGIARSYRISIDSLTAYNPGLTESIYPGEVIRIPLKVNPDEYITHKVREKTKLKKIASKYAVSVTAMKEANPGIRSKVYPGDLLFIPVGPPADIPPDDIHIVEPPPDDIPPRIVKKDSVRCFEQIYRHKKEYKVALMIPLYTEEARSIELREKGHALEPDKFKSFNFIHFYEGFRMAVEELEEQGFRVRVYVYDVDEKVSKTIQVLQDPMLSEMDLIIGPFFSRNFKLVSNFAEMFDIKIVNPLTRRTEVLKHDNVYKFKPDRGTQAEMLPAYVSTYHPEANIILVRNNKFEYADEIIRIREMLDRALPYGVKVPNSSIYDIIEDYSEADTNLAPGMLIEQLMVENRQFATADIENTLADSTFFSNGIAEVVYASDSIYGIMRNASLVRRNLVIVLSNNEIHVPEILTRLNDLKDTFDISVIGMPEWELLENLETDYLLDLDVHFFTDSYLDPDDPRVNDFIFTFRERFKTHPNSYAFEGYDLGKFFLGALHRFGTDCEKCLPYYYADALKGRIRFAPAKTSGYQNTLWNFCRYRNYKIERINLH
jgi:LysM repeat protein